MVYIHLLELKLQNFHVGVAKIVNRKRSLFIRENYQTAHSVLILSNKRCPAGVKKQLFRLGKSEIPSRFACGFCSLP